MALDIVMNITISDASQTYSGTPWEFVSTRIFWVLGIFIAINAYHVTRHVTNGRNNSRRFGKGADKVQGKSVAGQSRGMSPGPGSSSRDGSRNMGVDSGASEIANIPASPFDGFWIQPRITSRPRQYFGIAVGTLVLFLQIIEGSWVLRTACRVTVIAHMRMFKPALPLVLRCVAYLPGLFIGTIGWIIVLWSGFFLVTGQLIYIVEMKRLELGSPNAQQLGVQENEKKGQNELDEWEE